MSKLAAVVFCKLNEKEHKLEITSENLYFYLNNIAAGVGSHALVWNGSSFGIVQVVRVLDSSIDPTPSSNVTRALLTEIYLSSVDLKRVSKEIQELQSKAQRARIDQALDNLLGQKPPKETS